MTIRKFITFLKNFQENKGALNYILYHKDMVQIVIVLIYTRKFILKILIVLLQKMTGLLHELLKTLKNCHAQFPVYSKYLEVLQGATIDLSPP